MNLVQEMAPPTLIVFPRRCHTTCRPANNRDLSTVYPPATSQIGAKMNPLPPRLSRDVRLLRTCQQIYHEARSVLYQSNTFVFPNLSVFAVYFGLIAPNQLHMPRCTEPNRLRALQAMTNVELHAQIGDQRDPSFRSATRLIRTGLDCLTNLAIFKLSLNLFQQDQELLKWTIDDTVFSKPSSLRKFVVDVRIFNACLWRFGRVASKDHIVATEDVNINMAEEFSRRFLKQGGFSDETEDFWCHVRPSLRKPATD